MRLSRALLILAGTGALAINTTSFASASSPFRPAAVACDQADLVAAINAANTAGGGTITLTPGCTYMLTSSNGDDGVNGPDGLPVITTSITLSGNANTITRASTAPAFRIAEVTPVGGITLDAVTLSGGNATASSDDNGGGILSFGAVTLTGSALASNNAGGFGGALYASGASSASTFTSSTISGNTANQGAGLAVVHAALTTTSTTITNNVSTIDPGGIYFSTGTATLTTTSVTANSPANCVGSPSPVPGCVN
jgi:hypothetical protein